MYATRRKELKKAATADIKQYFEQFTKNKDNLSKKGDYEKKLLAAVISGKYLASQTSRTNPELSKQYNKIVAKYTKERSRVSNNSRW